MGTSQPPTEPLVAALEGTEYDTGLDLMLLSEIADYFRPIREKYLSDGTLNPKALAVDVNTLKYQVPGGMLSNLLSQLKQLGAEDKFEEVLKEIPRVREDAGFPPLVTPTSQIVGSQAVFNVVLGERYKNVTKEFRGMVKGEYGRTPVPISDEFAKKILGDEERITGRPADQIPNELDKFRSEISEYIEQDEDVLSYALFGPVATKYFEYRQGQKYKIDPVLADKENKVHPM